MVLRLQYCTLRTHGRDLARKTFALRLSMSLPALVHLTNAEPFEIANHSFPTEQMKQLGFKASTDAMTMRFLSTNC